MDCRMQAFFRHILIPGRKVRFYIHPADPVPGNDVEIPRRTVILGRISRCDEDPAFRKAVPSEGLELQELQHCRDQRLRDAVDLIKK